MPLGLLLRQRLGQSLGVIDGSSLLLLPGLQLTTHPHACTEAYVWHSRVGTTCVTPSCFSAGTSAASQNTGRGQAIKSGAACPNPWPRLHCPLPLRS
jgi:hypothetical protein